ncbi:PQQ-dependent sugar dehydrogenase [uncultured Sphingomonas sp.]|uniref:PQQ-dependent sugar dehydrogenase n=1 Tax=uncultured Sphingomonas sp. TaxID=158754 RepID=UPI0025D9F22F|nr:PQQ-dependent sugar dehydrogenase [uncultured Sphingomonas sp.]
MRTALLSTAMLLLAACSSGPGQAADAPAAGVGKLPFTVTPVAAFDAPWAMTFLPDKRMLVTEKAGRLLLVTADGGSRLTVAGTPAVFSQGQGGLMDVVLHPAFATNRLVYLSWSEEGPGGQGVALGRGKLVESGGQARLESFQVLFRAQPFVSGTQGHFSGRIAFSPDGKYLFFTNGERQKFDPAQDAKATLGKVLRLTPEGKPAPGNPLAARSFNPAVWSYGHRNLLGIAFDAQGNLWEQEMGPKGGDEVNLILPGRNYGWPQASNGSHYDGRDIPDHKPGDAFEPPKVWWNPVISPGGLMIYSGNLFPQWKGDAFIGGLSSMALVRVHLDGTNASKGDQWDMGKRIREVEQGPDGAIYLLEDKAGGRLLRLTPAA